MAEAIVAAVGASPGVAAGAARLLRPVADIGGELPAGDRDVAAESARAAAALEAAAARLDELAAAADGAEAEIIAANSMMARDPMLRAAVDDHVRERGSPAPAALVAGADEVAATLAAIDDPMLAARADDVRSVGRRAARIALGEDVRESSASPSGNGGTAAGVDPAVVIAEDLGPADVAELGDDVCAIALTRGAITAHAAIVARARGIPMIVAAGDAAWTAPSGGEVVVDGDRGRLVVTPSAERVAAARAAMRARADEQARAIAERDLPAVTRDGRVVRVLCNAASAAEVVTALAAGAEGAGLIRTELAFLDASDWPTEEDHARSLAPVLHALRGRTATVRVLDFGGDKTPPFLAGTPERGLRLLLGAPEPFAEQLRAIVRAGVDTDLRILFPMVETAADLAAARRLLACVAGDERPQIGAMIETQGAVDAAAELAARSDFLSIGTNDLTHAILGSDRFSAAEARTDHPEVMAAIDASVRAAHAAGIPIEVCGEAASDPAIAPLLVRLGVDELSVGAARVGPTRAAIRALDAGQAGVATR
jgi:phosphoenolpyruvate-protein kinase (PTS system EI component)